MTAGINRDAGHAVVEAMLLGLVLIVPLMWLLAVAGELHAAALATSSAAREAGADAARSFSDLEADRRVVDAVRAAIDDQGLDTARTHVRWTPARGWRRGDTIEVVVSYRVSAFQLPLLGRLPEPNIEVTGRHLAVIDRYRSRG